MDEEIKKKSFYEKGKRYKGTIWKIAENKKSFQIVVSSKPNVLGLPGNFPMELIPTEGMKVSFFVVPNPKTEGGYLALKIEEFVEEEIENIKQNDNEKEIPLWLKIWKHLRNR